MPSSKKKLLDYDINNVDVMKGKIDKMLKELFPITRSITGDGVRQTYKILNKIAKFKIYEIPTGKKCYNWIVPKEWVIRDAYVEDDKGKRIIDFKKNNLHVLNYSTSVNDTVSYAKLTKHLYTLPQMPEAVPYRTSYYKKNWGFCISYDQFKKLDKKAKYKVYIDAKHKKGNLTLGDYRHKGISKEEYLISTYSCHPSLANDNLSGMVLWIFLLKILQSLKTRHNYKFCIWPETIGAMVYLSTHEEEMKRVNGGFVVATVGGTENFGYKKTFLGDGRIDRAVRRAFRKFDTKLLLYQFEPIGSDERQLSSPGFRIPTGTITKGKYGEYPYYHTSLDNLDYVKAENIAKTLKLYLASLQELEANVTLKSNLPFCEPNLGERGLYPATGGAINSKNAANKDLDIMRWVLFYADGDNSALDISEKTGFSAGDVNRVANVLIANKVIQ